jgi:Flp pilus assembly protein TadD/predicted Zn-dependent protease with MMP-like domain
VSRALLAIVFIGCGACRPNLPTPRQDAASSDETRLGMRSTPSRPEAAPMSEPAPFQPRALRRCFEEDGSAGPPRALGVLLDRASERHEVGDFAAALACAEEAVRVDARSVEAHEDRALALAELGRKEEARAAIGRALSIDPDDPHTLLAAADLLLNRLGGKDAVATDDAATALEHARRGALRLRRARSKSDRQLRARLELVTGQALSDLGRAKEALPHLDAALAVTPDDLTARYERGLALFELCRFADAEHALREVVAKDPSDAFAHQQLGLALEQLGNSAAAARELAEAHRLNPNEIRAALDIDRARFEQIVHEEIAALPDALRTDLGRVGLELPDLPNVADLTADDPPLPPTILGLFRGAPLGADLPAESATKHRHQGHGDPEPIDGEDRRAIALYRLNLLRAVGSVPELRDQIRTTLHHELGHLRGEDDEVLRLRGLE